MRAVGERVPNASQLVPVHAAGGAEAGNLALKVLATGGIYLGGGMSPRILTDLEKPVFLEALRNKGRLRGTLTNMPVHVILNPDAGLLGTAAYGLTMSS